MQIKIIFTYFYWQIYVLPTNLSMRILIIIEVLKMVKKYKSY